MTIFPVLLVIEWERVQGLEKDCNKNVIIFKKVLHFVNESVIIPLLT